MICPFCRAIDSGVAKTIDDSDVVIRQRACAPCGARWVTTEAYVHGMRLNEPQRPHLDSGGQGKSPGRALGGAGVGLVPLLFPVSPSGPSQQSGSGRAIRRGRPDTAEYTPEFLALWALAKAQGKAGNKAPAFKAWLRLNADAELNALIATRFEEWMKTDSWRRGFNFHFVTWLNQRGWEEPPTAADLRGTEAASAPTRDIRGADYCVWHQRHQNDGTVSRYPKGGCPGCKAVTMAEAERSHAAEVAKIMAERARKTQ